MPNINMHGNGNVLTTSKWLNHGSHGMSTFDMYICMLQGFCSVLLALERLGLLNHSQFQRLNPGAADIRWVSCHHKTIIM